MTVKIAPEAAIDTAATTRTKITMLKNDIIAASIGQAGGATTATDAATMRKARPSSAPSSRDVPAPPSAFEVMEIFTPRIGKVRLDSLVLRSRGEGEKKERVFASRLIG